MIKADELVVVELSKLEELKSWLNSVWANVVKLPHSQKRTLLIETVGNSERLVDYIIKSGKQSS